MATLLVHLQLGQSNTALLQVAADLARRLDAEVIGIAACQPLQIIYNDGYLMGDLMERDLAEIEKDIKDAEAEFRGALGSHRGNLGWRSTITSAPLARYLADQARCADLLITSVDHNGSLLGSTRHVDIGDLIMQLGRPALIVPSEVVKTSLERVLIGWKDTREARRAVLDALPLLQKAEHVAVCEIAAEHEMAEAEAHLADVVRWLKSDGIVAEPIAALATADDAARLDVIATEQAADVVVAGAYGHSRLREWALGGVTKDLLLQASRCCLVSH